jgi:hypothetical protein
VEVSGERGRIPRRNEETLLGVRNQLMRCTGSRRDNRQSKPHGF